MNYPTQKPVTDLTTDELASAYLDRLLEEGAHALDTGRSVEATPAFFESLRQHVHKVAAGSK